MEVGSCQGKEKVEGDKSAISPAADVATAADGVIGTAMKSCIQKHPTHLDQRPLRPPKGALARFQGCFNDNIGGRGRLLWPGIVLQQEQASFINTVDTGDKIFPRCR